MSAIDFHSAFPKSGDDDLLAGHLRSLFTERGYKSVQDSNKRFRRDSALCAIEDDGAASQPLHHENSSAGSRGRCAACVEPVGHCGSRHCGRRQAKGQSQSCRSQEGFEDPRHCLSSLGVCFDERKLIKTATVGCAGTHMAFFTPPLTAFSSKSHLSRSARTHETLCGQLLLIANEVFLHAALRRGASGCSEEERCQSSPEISALPPSRLYASQNWCRNSITV